MSDLIKELHNLIREANVRICFCIKCNHDRKHGRCEHCWCQNVDRVQHEQTA